MNIDLNALVVFFDVVNERSITKAARKLGLPKSTVSRKILHLEGQVGAALLKRGNRRISVTEAGHRLHEHCARIAAEVEDAGLQAAQLRTSLRGPLRVSVPIDFGTGWLSRAIASFAEKYAAIDLDIHATGRWVDVSEESFDVAIQFGHPINPDVPRRRLGALTRGIYASPVYIERRGLPHGRWHEHDYVLTEQQIAERIWEIGADMPERRRSRVTINNIGVARELVISGLGIGIFPNVMCRNDVKSGRLVAVPTDRAIPPLEASATFFAGRHVPRKTKVFLDHIGDFIAADAVQKLDERWADTTTARGPSRFAGEGGPAKPGRMSRVG